MLMRWAVALLALGLLGLLEWLPRRVGPGRGLALLRCLLPSWRFFEQLEPLPRLEYRVAPQGDGWGGWQAVPGAPRRTLGSLFFNAAGNLHFARQSLIEHLVVELDDAADEAAHDTRSASELIAYRLVCNWVELELRAARQASPALRYQFRLSSPEGAALFVSEEHGVA